MADGSITFSTALDNSELDKQIKDAEAQINNLKKTVEQKTSKRNAIKEKIDEADQAIEATRRDIDRLKARLEELDAAGESPMSGRRQAVVEELDKASNSLVKQVENASALDSQYYKIDEEVAQYIPSTENLSNQKAQSLFLTYSHPFGPLNVSIGLRYEHVDFDYEVNQKHDDEVIIAVPPDVDLTVAEQNQEYSASFTLNDGQPQRTNTMTFSITDDATLEVVNTLGIIVPTGIAFGFSPAFLISLLVIAIIVAFIMWRKKGLSGHK